METLTVKARFERSRADYRKRIKIVDALRRVFEKVKHYQTFNGRIEKVIKSELSGYTVSVDQRANLHNLSIWGKDIDYSQRFHICFHQSKPWQEAFSEELDIADCSDYLERLDAEEQILAELIRLNSELLAIRSTAKELIETLPIPQCCVTRKKPQFWDRPSSALSDAFPALFKDYRD